MYERAMGTCAILILLVMTVVAVAYSYDLRRLEQLTSGYTVVKIQQLKDKCEETLTRQQQCTIIVSAVPISKEK